MLLPRPACNDPTVLITWDGAGSVAYICFVSRGFRRHPARQPSPGCVVVVCVSAAEVNPDVRAAHVPLSRETGCCVCRESELTSPRRRTRTRQAATRPRDRRGEGACFGSLDPFADRAEPPPDSTQNPHPFVSRFGWGESKARRGGPGVLFPVSLRMTARCHPRPTSATTGRAAPWACGAAR